VHADVAREPLERLGERRSERTSSSFCSRSASSGSIARACLSVMSLPGWNGISFAMPSQNV
jgi:hypothetical protein